MATLFAVIYPTSSDASNAFDQAKALENAGYMRILEQALIRKDSSGEIKIGDENHPVLKGAGIGAVVGVLTGAIFLIPVAGLALGAAVGGLLGRHGKSGAEEDFKRFQQTVSSELQPGGGAILLLIQSDATDRVVNDLGRFGGKLLSYDLSDEQLADLQSEIDKLSSQ
ncbi:MAG: DUF1269 domain-containing protein [Thermomicrobiales bacterium]|nr:DUF1269 domain-containing protein [Thermomicrobiales bacterium]MCO5223388.1 DUF1269 domain-containing protein [Thermomicrobiales bacterium]